MTVTDALTAEPDTCPALPQPAFAFTGPGVYPEVPDELYHRDQWTGEPSLSASGAKKLLPPSCPAIFKWDRDHPPAPKKEFDFGHAAHRMVLGVGADLEVVPGERWDTKAAKEAVAAARAAGRVPLKEKDMAQVDAMAKALREDPIAAKLLEVGSGTPEASLYWRDDETHVLERSRIDFLPNEVSSGGRLIVVDYKSAESADPQKFARNAYDYGYDIQAAKYVKAVRALELAEDAAFLFVVQQKTAPYLVSVVQLDSLAMRIGEHRNRKALRIFNACMTADHWPTWSDDVELVSLPGWAVAEFERETA